MGTIQTYDQDTSATARLNSWEFGWNMAQAKPIVGGGFQSFQQAAFTKWAPDPTRVWDAHSIWISILAEHGFVGLTLFVAFWISAWLLANKIIRATRGVEGYGWAGYLAAMIQVSSIGYWVGGAFLSLAYWDFPYILVALLVLTWTVVQRALGKHPAETKRPAAIASMGVRKPVSGGTR
jgi:probable O-glycosylation ligase (exosortase A-associated)